MALGIKDQKDVSPKLSNCPDCDEIVVAGASGPVKYRLSRISIPLAEAMVLLKYGHMVYNLWPGKAIPGWTATDWWGQPFSKGRLYTAHDCYARK